MEIKTVEGKPWWLNTKDVQAKQIVWTKWKTFFPLVVTPFDSRYLDLLRIHEKTEEDVATSISTVALLARSTLDSQAAILMADVRDKTSGRRDSVAPPAATGSPLQAADTMVHSQSGLPDTQPILPPESWRKWVNPQDQVPKFFHTAWEVRHQGGSKGGHFPLHCGVCATTHPMFFFFFFLFFFLVSKPAGKTSSDRKLAPDLQPLTGAKRGRGRPRRFVTSVFAAMEQGASGHDGGPTSPPSSESNDFAVAIQHDDVDTPEGTEEDNEGYEGPEEGPEGFHA